MTDYETDLQGRRIIPDDTVPNVYSSERFDRWRGGLLAPDTVLTHWTHSLVRGCVEGGWIRSGGWWFVCGDCHPDAIDSATGQSKRSQREVLG